MKRGRDINSHAWCNLHAAHFYRILFTNNYFLIHVSPDKSERGANNLSYCNLNMKILLIWNFWQVFISECIATALMLPKYTRPAWFFIYDICSFGTFQQHSIRIGWKVPWGCHKSEGSKILNLLWKSIFQCKNIYFVGKWRFESSIIYELVSVRNATQLQNRSVDPEKCSLYKTCGFFNH